MSMNMQTPASSTVDRSMGSQAIARIRKTRGAPKELEGGAVSANMTVEGSHRKIVCAYAPSKPNNDDIGTIWIRGTEDETDNRREVNPATTSPLTSAIHSGKTIFTYAGCGVLSLFACLGVGMDEVMGWRWWLWLGSCRVCCPALRRRVHFGCLLVRELILGGMAPVR